MTVCVGVICAGSVHMDCAASLDRARQVKAFSKLIFHQSGPYVDDARNAVVRAFLRETTCDRLLMIDSDISFVPADIARLEADKLDIVTGVYYNLFDGQIKPVLTLIEDEVKSESDEPLLEVVACGGGFLMMTRRMLEKMLGEYGEPCPWFAEPIDGPIHWGEDVTFCLRARELGYKVIADLRVQVSHYKTIRLQGPTVAPDALPAQMPGQMLKRVEVPHA